MYHNRALFLIHTPSVIREQICRVCPTEKIQVSMYVKSAAINDALSWYARAGTPVLFTCGFSIVVQFIAQKPTAPSGHCMMQPCPLSRLCPLLLPRIWGGLFQTQLLRLWTRSIMVPVAQWLCVCSSRQVTARSLTT